jgi:hypothetical protein
MSKALLEIAGPNRIRKGEALPRIANETVQP